MTAERIIVFATLGGESKKKHRRFLGRNADLRKIGSFQGVDGDKFCVVQGTGEKVE